MRRLHIISYFFLLGISCLSSCEQAQDIKDVLAIEGKQITITAFHNSDNTRTAIIDGGAEVYWQVGDAIKLFRGEEGTMLVSNVTGLSKVATFTGPVPEGAGDFLGLYPYSEDAVFDGTDIIFTLPENQLATAGSFAQNTHITVGRSSTTEMGFYSVCGGIRFSLSQEGIKRVTFEGGNNEIIAGTVKATFDASGKPLVHELGKGHTKISLTTPDGSAFKTNQWYYFEIIPCELSEGYRLTFFKDEESASVFSTSMVSIRRGVYGSLSNVDDGLVFRTDGNKVFPSVIVLDSNKISSCIVDDSAGTCTISFADHVPDIHSGSVLCLNQGGGADEVFLVTSATTTGNTVELCGRKGDYSYVFNDTSFTLSTGESSAYAPRMNYYEPRQVSNQWTLWRGTYSDMFTLYSSNALRLTADFELNSGIDAEFTFNFNGVTTSVIDGIKFLRSRDFTTSFKLLGSLDFNTTLTGAVNVDHDVNLSPSGEDKTELLKHNFLPAKDIVFPVFGIPVPIHIGCDLCQEVRTTVRGELELNLSSNASFRGETGFSYNMDDGSQPFQTYNSYQMSITREDPVLSGWGDITGTYFLFPRIYAWIGYVAGPALEIRPYAKVSLSGAMQMDLVESSTADYLSSSFNAYIGAEWAIGISTPMEHYFYESSRTMRNMGVIGEFCVASSPVALELTSANTDRVRKGKLTSLSFTALADYYGTRSKTVFPTIVKIEIPKAEISTYRYSWTGLFDYSWTPQSDEEILYATIYDNDGSVIDQVQFGDGTEEEVVFCPDGNHPHMIDLGLPSGRKWACCNVGSTSPEGYGEYFAWGETEPNADYFWPTYKFWVSGDSLDNLLFNKYCPSNKTRYWGGSGSPDNKTVLEPEDDAARANWGGSWRMPTDAEWTELLENCTWTWTDNYNGTRKKGRVVTGRNGNSIFLPSAGRLYNTYLSSAGSYGYYWSSSLNTDTPSYARLVSFSSRDVHGIGSYRRYTGLSVRPVSE